MAFPLAAGVHPRLALALHFSRRERFLTEDANTKHLGTPAPMMPAHFE
jgi:hypothetical protein